MSFDKLKGKMAEAHVSQAKLSGYLGITVQSLNAKLNGRTQFTLEEAVKITEFLNLKDPVDIFFASQKCNTVMRVVSRKNEVMEENEHLRSNKESTGRKQVYKRETL